MRSYVPFGHEHNGEQPRQVASCIPVVDPDANVMAREELDHFYTLLRVCKRAMASKVIAEWGRSLLKNISNII